MQVSFLDLKRQYAKVKNEVESAVASCMESCYYIQGPQVAAFEKEIGEYLGVKHVIGCANGTDALVLALRACGIGIGDEVITTPFSFFATAEAIASVGAIPIFVDINSESLNIDPDQIDKKINKRTKAIMPVHIFGLPAEMDSINKLAKKHNLKVIEDACQAIGSEYKSKKAGGLGDIGCFSFYPTKNLGAFGDAGMVTTNNDDLAVVLKALHEHGMGKNGAEAAGILFGKKDAMTSEKKQSDPLYNPYKYFNYLVGYNSRLDAMQAVVLRIKLKYLDSYNRSRASIAAMYTGGLQQLNITLPRECKEGKTVWHQYSIRTPLRDELAAFLSKNGVGTGAFYPVPLHLQNAFEKLGYKPGDLPIAEKAAKESLCLPIYPELTNDEVKYVIEKIEEFYKNRK